MNLRRSYVLAVIATASACWFAIGQRALKRDVARLEASIAALRDEVDEQRTLIRMTAAVAAAVPRGMPAAAAPPAQANESKAGTPPQAAPPEEEGSTDALPRYESRFANEAFDPSWAAESEQLLTTSLAALAGSGSSLRVTCRTSLCRAEIRLTDGAQLDQFVEKSSAGAFWPGGQSSTLTPSPSDHSVVVTTFFTKEGPAFPEQPGPS